MNNPYITHIECMNEDGEMESLEFKYRRLTVQSSLEVHRMLEDIKGKPEHDALSIWISILDATVTNWDVNDIPYDIATEVVLKHPTFRPRQRTTTD